MSYRTKSLFHYTKSFDSIIKILEAGVLYPNYCKEDLSTDVNDDYYWGIPMICFCDIPLSRSQDLKDNYGNYAIAFDKEWGIGNNCNPVQYVSNELIINSAVYSIDRLRELKKELREYKPIRDSHGNLIYDFKELLNELDDAKVHNHLLGYLKKYLGEWKGEPYCNYNENEWRYVLEDGEKDVEWLFKGDYDTWRGSIYVAGEEKINPKPEPSEALKRQGLSFSVSDIKHIVLNTESEISEFIHLIMEMPTIFGGRHDVERIARETLLTRVTTFERISSDY